MIVSFFDDGTFVTGADYSFKRGSPEILGTPEITEVLGEDGEIITPYQEEVYTIPAIPDSGREDCIGVYEIDFDPSTQTLRLEDSEVIIEDLPEPQETDIEKHSRIYKSVITTSDLSEVDLEDETFSDIEVGDLITARCFGNNPHAEKALTNKVLAVALALLQGVTMTDEMAMKVADATAKKAEVDSVRNLFNLGNL